MGKKVKNMKLWSLFFIAAVAAQEAIDESERGKANAAEKGANSCVGVVLEHKDFKCKAKKKKKGKDDNKVRRKRCRVLCENATMKKVYCNEDGWGKKGGDKVNPKKIC